MIIVLEVYTVKEMTEFIYQNNMKVLEHLNYISNDIQIHSKNHEILYQANYILKELHKSDNKVKNIGVSNFNVEHLEALLAQVSIKPVINQVEFHPYLLQESLRRYLEVQNIHMESWSPLMNAQILEDATVKSVAEEVGKSPAQVIIRWNIEHGVVVIPKSVTPSRIEENLNVFDFNLTPTQIEKLDSLNEDKRIGPDPIGYNGH